MPGMPSYLRNRFGILSPLASKRLFYPRLRRLIRLWRGLCSSRARIFNELELAARRDSRPRDGSRRARNPPEFKVALKARAAYRSITVPR